MTGSQEVCLGCSSEHSIELDQAFQISGNFLWHFLLFFLLLFFKSRNSKLWGQEQTQRRECEALIYWNLLNALHIFLMYLFYHSIKYYICFVDEWWGQERLTIFPRSPSSSFPHCQRWWRGLIPHLRGTQTCHSTYLMVILMVTPRCLDHGSGNTISWFPGLWSLSCLVLNKECLEHQVRAFPDCQFVSPRWPATRTYCLQELPTKGQAAGYLPYHMEELEEVHVGVQGVLHPL